MQLRSGWVPALAFVLAGAGAVFSALVFARVANANAAWLLIAGAAILAALGWLTFEERRDKQREIVNKQSHIDLLQGQLDRQRQAIDALADGLEVAIFICDSRGLIEYANREAVESFRMTSPQGKSLVATTLSHDLEGLVQRAAASENPQHAELSFTYPEDRIGIAKAWSSPSGRVFLSLVDITELRRLERIRTDFVANVSHEMRTPMTIIRAMAETLQDDDDAETRARYLAKIISEVDRLSTISQDLLVLSTAESNPVRKQETDLAEIVGSVVSQLRGKAQEKGLEIAYSGPREFLIQANSNQMTQVALNLVENAINYTPEGRVEVAVAQLGDQAVLTVRDSGMGIASDQLPRIFERFYRVDKARSRSTGGTGLGLSIVKHIVEAHGGRVTVESALNQGSEFTVTLPIGSPSSAATNE